MKDFVRKLTENREHHPGLDWVTFWHIKIAKTTDGLFPDQPTAWQINTNLPLRKSDQILCLGSWGHRLKPLSSPRFDGFVTDGLMLAVLEIENKKSQVNPRVKWELYSKILIWDGESFPVRSWVRHGTILSSQVLRKQKGHNDCAIDWCPPGQVASVACAHTKNATPLPPTTSAAQSYLSPSGRTPTKKKKKKRICSGSEPAWPRKAHEIVGLVLAETPAFCWAVWEVQMRIQAIPVS